MVVEEIATMNPYVGTFALLTVVLILTWTLWNKQTAETNSPPGPKGFDLILGLISMRKFAEKTFERWGKTYGPLFMFKVGPAAVVVISCPDIAYEAFAKQEYFNDRPQSVPLLKGGLGLVMVNRTDFQKEQRRFALNTLREFGMGRRSLEPCLVEFSSQLCHKIDALCKKEGVSEPFQIKFHIYDLVSKVISSIIFGYDITNDNEGFSVILKKLMGLEKPASRFLSALLFMVPILKHLPFFSYAWKRGKMFQEEVHNEIMKEVKEHQARHNVQNQTDFIDCFLSEMKKASHRNESDGNQDKNTKSGTEENANTENLDEKNLDFSSSWKPLSSFHDKQLVAGIRDLFIAGSDTTSTVFLWIFFYLCLHPEVQKKMQEEIDGVLGQSGVPQMSMLEKFPYVRAVLQEITRIRPIVPLSVPHLASRDAYLKGYKIPKGAVILTNIWAIHHDKTRWPEPKKFLPERHLDNTGKFMKSSNHLLFGVGTRSCLGQQLANMELFITTVSLFQKFQFSFPPGYVSKQDGESIITLRPFDFKLIAKRR